MEGPGEEILAYQDNQLHRTLMAMSNVSVRCGKVKC